MSQSDAESLFESADAFAHQSATAAATQKKKFGSDRRILDLPESPEHPPTPTIDLGDVIDGTEDDISDLEQETAPFASDVGDDDRDPTVTAAVQAVLQATATKKRIPPMADNAKKTTVTKADSIRATITKMKAAGTDAIRPRDVIAALDKDGITVTAPQVSVMLRDWDKQTDKPTPRAKVLTAATAAVKSAKTNKTTSSPPLPNRQVANKVRSVDAAPQAQPQAQPVNGAAYPGLMQTAAFVKSVGGTTAARELLSVFEQLMAAGG